MYDSYPEELCDHYERHGKSLPSLKSKQGQALAWLAQPEMRGGRGWIDRESAVKFFNDNNMKSSDPIQPFNKPGGSTPGLKLDNTRGKGFYSLKFPFEFNDEEKRSNVRMNVCMNGTKEEQVKSVKDFHLKKLETNMKDAEMFLSLLNKTRSRDVYERLVKEIHHMKWVIRYILEQPTKDWQIGHLIANPPKEANDPSNLYYQPPIQAKFRDNYIFNPGFERIKVKV